MREILFRGQTRRKGEKVWMDGSPVESNWVYGGIFQGPNRSVIYGYDPIEKYCVYSDTVGQFTGLTDKNGKMIFEGDILEYKSNMISLCSGYKTGEVEVSRRVVEWGEYGWIYKEIYNNRWNPSWNNYGRKDHLYKKNVFEFATVIGNIHDNPELVVADG